MLDGTTLVRVVGVNVKLCGLEATMPDKDLDRLDIRASRNEPGGESDLKPIQWVKTSAVPVQESHTGLSAVVPAKYLKEILLGTPAASSRLQ